MKLDSDLFDSIRIKPNRRNNKKKATLETDHKNCEWSGCEEEGKYRAPKGRGQESQYHFFCIEHVKQYNKNYNYFVNMSDEEIKSFQKDAVTGHRPTWKIKAGNATGRINKLKSRGLGIEDNELKNSQEAGSRPNQGSYKPRRKARNAEKASLIKLGLDEFATPDEVKVRFKLLVKNLHPDLNKNQKGNDDRLKDVIQAYNYLKSSGFFKKE